MNQGKIVVHVAKNKEKYFTVVAENHKVIATSETYKTDNGLRNGIKALTDMFRQTEFDIEGIDEVGFKYKYGWFSKVLNYPKQLIAKT